ncbi:MAG: hypothetical protein NC307_06300 [Roseburia sp.]|nr:hypothetical protein [Roseburia sp.]
MKLKYYLRGIGIGVVVTTLIFMVSIALHKNEVNPKTPEEDKKPATVADMLEAESETESEATEEEKKSDPDTSAQKSTEVKKEETKGSETKLPEQKSSETKPGDAKTDTPKTDNKDTTTDTDKISSDASGTDKGKVRFEIGGGEYSDVVCKKLQQADLVDSAEEFNKFLIANKYDNAILPGVYAIPKGASYEEIAKLLTTKIEEN